MPDQLIFITRRRNTLEMEKQNERFFQLSVMCLGWSQIVDVCIYCLLFVFSTKSTNPSKNSTLLTALQVALLVAIVVSIIYACLLIVAAHKKRHTLVNIGSSFCLGLSLIDLVLGILGIAVYYRGAAYTVNFIMLLMYVFLLIQILWALCFDFPRLVVYGEILTMPPIIVGAGPEDAPQPESGASPGKQVSATPEKQESATPAIQENDKYGKQKSDKSIKQKSSKPGKQKETGRAPAAEDETTIQINDEEPENRK